MTKRDGKYRKRDVERLKEEEQVAALDEVCKAQTFVLKDTHTEFVGNPTPAFLCLDDLMKDNRAAGERREAQNNTVYPNIAYNSSLEQHSREELVRFIAQFNRVMHKSFRTSTSKLIHLWTLE